MTKDQIQTTKELETNPRLTRCADCGREISVRAAACPHCGAPAAPPEIEKFVAAAGARKSSNLSTLLAFLICGPIIFVCALVIAGSVLSTQPKTKEEAIEANSRMAWFMGCVYVEKQLAPKPSKFPNPDTEPGQTHSANDDGTFEAAGYVDTVNDFNGPVRRYWRTRVRPDGDGNWTCLDLKIE